MQAYRRKLIGWSLFGFIPLGPGLLAAFLGYALNLVAFTVLALIATRLAPPFQGEGDLEQALKLVAYASTPSWIGGVFRLVPVLGIVSLSRQRNQPDLEGQGLAIAGIILGVFPFLWGAYAMVIVLLAATAPR